MIHTLAFPFTDEWQQVIATLEAALRLHNHTTGTLPTLARYLHQRTGGMIGSLSHLIRGAAIEAIMDGSEQITESQLERIDLDLAAEQNTNSSKAVRKSRSAKKS